MILPPLPEPLAWSWALLMSWSLTVCRVIAPPGPLLPLACSDAPALIAAAPTAAVMVPPVLPLACTDPAIESWVAWRLKLPPGPLLPLAWSSEPDWVITCGAVILICPPAELIDG